MFAVMLMLASAYSVARLLATVASISALTGAPQYETVMPTIQRQAKWWEVLALTLPLVSALVLSFGAKPLRVPGGSHGLLTYTAESPAAKATALVARYSFYLLISVLGTLGFLILLYVIGLIFYKSGIPHRVM